MLKIKNLTKAAKRIKKAIEKDENIILFSDCDLDGTTSLIILEETIKSLGGKITLRFFPSRSKEGYGLNDNSLRIIKKYSPGLLILLDCGISNFEEIKKAKEMGFFVLVIEHHEILGKIPKADIVVDPKQRGDKYPFNFFATCGICFKLAGEIMGKMFNGSNMEKNLLELATLGTIADKMPQREDNKVIIEDGLKILPFTQRPGLKVFFKKFSLRNHTLKEIIQKMVSVLQITDTKNFLTGSYELLSISNEKEAKKILVKLLKSSLKRHKLIKRLSEKLEKKVLKERGELLFIFEGEKGLDFSLVGALASRIGAKFRKPTFIFGEKDDLVRGSARAAGEVNTVKALMHCSSSLETFGGHPPASGFSLEKKNLAKFKECLEEYFKKNYE